MPESAHLEQRLHSIIGAFYRVYNTLGFGFLESIYAAALTRELVSRGHAVRTEQYVWVYYDGDPIAMQRIDMLVGACQGFCVSALKRSVSHGDEAALEEETEVG